MAFKLDNDLLEELGLAALSADEKQAMLRQILETLEMRVGTTLASRMSDAQLDEFERLMPAEGDDQAAVQQKEQQALQWLETNFPNYKQVVNDELEKLKGEIKQSAPQIVAASSSSLSGGAVQTLEPNGQQAGLTAPAPTAPAEPQSFQQPAPTAPPMDFAQPAQPPFDQAQASMPPSMPPSQPTAPYQPQDSSMSGMPPAPSQPTNDYTSPAAPANPQPNDPYQQPQPGTTPSQAPPFSPPSAPYTPPTMPADNPSPYPPQQPPFTPQQ